MRPSYLYRDSGNPDTGKTISLYLDSLQAEKGRPRSQTDNELPELNHNDLDQIKLNIFCHFHNAEYTDTSYCVYTENLKGHNIDSLQIVQAYNMECSQ